MCVAVRKSRDTALGAIGRPTFDRHQGSVSILTILGGSIFSLLWPYKPLSLIFSSFHFSALLIPSSLVLPTENKNKCKAKEKMSCMPTLWSRMLRASICECPLLSNNCMKYDNQFISGETKAERGMWPAQGHTAIIVEHDLNSRQVEHPCYTIPGAPIRDVLSGCPPGAPGAVHHSSLLDHSWTLPYGALFLQILTKISKKVKFILKGAPLTLFSTLFCHSQDHDTGIAGF